MRSGPSDRLLVVGAFAVLWLVWGSTFLVAKVAVETVPPLLLVAIRCLLAGALTLALPWRSSGRPAPPWGVSLVVGTLLFVGGQGALATALETVPSGVAALLGATTPLWMALFAWLAAREQRPSAREGIGVLLGLGGMTILTAPWRVGDVRTIPLGGALLVLLSAISWAAGSIVLRSRTGAGTSRRLATARQFLAGGAVAALVAAARGDLARVGPDALSPATAAAVLYLLLFGSLLGFVAYSWLLGRTTAARVASYAYVNPLVAIALGWSLGGEPITPRVLVAAAITVTAIALVVTPPRIPRPAAGGVAGR
jgi:drug/metabolite transporter (DMT)-like permease